MVGLFDIGWFTKRIELFQARSLRKLLHPYLNVYRMMRSARNPIPPALGQRHAYTLYPAHGCGLSCGERKHTRTSCGTRPKIEPGPGAALSSPTNVDGAVLSTAPFSDSHPPVPLRGGMPAAQGLGRSKHPRCHPGRARKRT